MQWCAHRNQSDAKQRGAKHIDTDGANLESGPEAEEKVVFFEFAERNLVESKMEEFIMKHGLLHGWTFAIYAADGSKVQDDPVTKKICGRSKLSSPRRRQSRNRAPSSIHPGTII